MRESIDDDLSGRLWCPWGREGLCHEWGGAMMRGGPSQMVTLPWLQRPSWRATSGDALMGWMGAGFAVLVVWCWMRWGHTGWPIGSYWWDELALAGAAEAIRTGLVPTVDFWAPFVLPLYLKQWAIAWVGYGGSFVAECLMQGALVLLLFWGLVGRERQPLSVYGVGALAVLGAVAPFNLGSATEAQLGSAVAACAYNRLGGAILSLVMLLPAIRRDAAHDGRLTGWLAVTFVLTMLLKITVFQIAWVLIFLKALLEPRSGLWRVLCGATLLAVVTLGVLAWIGGGAKGYVSALQYLSEVRMSLLKGHVLSLVGYLVFTQRFPMALMLLCALIVIARAHLASRLWLRHVAWYLVACGATCAYTSTNWGDHGLLPATAAMCTLLLACEVGTLEGVVPEAQRRIDRLLRISGYGLLWGGLVLFLAAMAYWAWALDERRADEGMMHMPVRSALFAGNYVIEPKAWDKRPDMLAADLPINLLNPGVYASYVEGLEGAYAYLDRWVPDRSLSVYALDFPAYVFSAMGGYRVPRHSYPWMLFDHEITIDHHPDAETLLSDVDVLMVSKCSLSGGNRKWLHAIYRVHIEAHWKREASVRCWDVYRRRSGP